MLSIPSWTYVGPPDSNYSGAMQNFMGVVLHIAEGSYQGTINWQKNPDSDVSSHTVHGKAGQRAQMLDINLTAWTQANGNGHWISIEHEGFSGESLTPEQLESTAALYAWAVEVKGIPLQITDSVNVPGLGWHGMGGTAWGGHPNCPGEPIKAQRSAILARAQEILNGDDMPTPEEYAAAVLAARIPVLKLDENGTAVPDGTTTVTLGEMLSFTNVAAWAAADALVPSVPDRVPLPGIRPVTVTGTAPPPGPVNLTPEAVQAVAVATADEIAADPERDGRSA